MKVFISGSISINELPQPAMRMIDRIIAKHLTVLIGDARGADLRVQEYFLERQYHDIIVYFIGERVRNNVGNWTVKEIYDDSGVKKGRALYTLKDIAMTKDSDCGLMIWDGTSPGTLNNIMRMKNERKRFYVVLNGTVIDDTGIDYLINTKNRQIKRLQQEA
jgi:hypothetical protein